MTRPITKPRGRPKTLNKLRGLPQYAGKSDQELQKIADAISHKIQVGDAYMDKKEKRFAKEILRKYLDEYNIETNSDKNTLKQLIFLEVVDNRLRLLINKFHSEDNATPLNLLNEFHTNITQITRLKETLGLTKAQEAETKDSAFKALETLKNKFKTYIQENRDEFLLRTPCCGKMLLLRRRIKDFDVLEHPHFKGSILYNQKLFDLINSNKITVSEAADVLGTTVDYVEWVMGKYYKYDKESGEV